MTADLLQCWPSVMPSEADLGQALRELRLERGMTMLGLTDAAGLHVMRHAEHIARARRGLDISLAPRD